MGFTLTVEGAEKIFYGKDIITVSHMALTSPNNSRARASKNDVTVYITGKLHADAADGKNSATLKLAQWAQVPAEQEQDAYRQATIEVIHEGQCFRKILLTKAFVVDYSEQYTDTKGIGTFSLTIRQKADIQNEVKIDGGLPMDDAVDDASPNATPGDLIPSSQPGAVPGLAATLEQAAAAAVLNKLDPSGTVAAVLASTASGTGVAGMSPGAIAKTGDVLTPIPQNTGIGGLENAMSQEAVTAKINNLYGGNPANVREEFANLEHRTTGASELSAIKPTAVNEELHTTDPSAIIKELKK